MRNLWLKLFSIVIAIALAWYVHSESNSAVRTFVAPVRLQDIPLGKIVVSPVNAVAQVTVKGPSYIVAKIPIDPPVFSLSFPQTGASDYRVALSANMLALPPYVEVLTIAPPELNFVLENQVARELPVVVPHIGTISAGLEIKSSEVSPERITVRAGASQLAKLSELETEPLDLSTVHGPVQAVLRVRNWSDPSELSTDRVTVKMDVAPVVIERKFEQVPVEVRALPGKGYSVQPTAVSVTVSGPKAGIETLKHTDIVAFVRVPETLSIPAEVAIGAEVPQGMRVASIDPQNAKVLQSPEPKPEAVTKKEKPRRRVSGTGE